jgi:2-oxoglutarate ferredoxin oxidoreductase subunit alpha
VLSRLRRKYETAKGLVPAPVFDEDGAKIGLIAFGSTDPAIQEARDHLAERGLKTDYMRLRAVPFTSEVADFIRRHDRNYVIELNRDGQMHQLLRLEVQGCATELISLAHIDGLPLSAQWVVNALLAEEEIS